MACLMVMKKTMACSEVRLQGNLNTSNKRCLIQKERMGADPLGKQAKVNAVTKGGVIKLHVAFSPA